MSDFKRVIFPRPKPLQRDRLGEQGRRPPPPPPPIREPNSMELTKDARGVPYYVYTDDGWKLRDDWMEHRENSYLVKYGERPKPSFEVRDDAPSETQLAVFAGFILGIASTLAVIAVLMLANRF